jgi:leader peptidase (prepilin peptidase)/N-methyltransferase
VESITGLAFVVIYLQTSSILFICYAIIFTLGSTIFLQDIKYQAIHERLLQLLIAITLIFNFFHVIPAPQQSAGLTPAGILFPFINIKIPAFAGMTYVIYGMNLHIAFLSALPFYILFKLSREKWLGEGDVWLAAWMGLFLGFPRIFWAIYVGLILGGLVSLIVILLKLKKMRDTISLGPFLLIGTLISLFIK